MSYLGTYSTKETPQSEPIPGTVPNSAGGHSFPVDDWVRLERFLILGAEGGTYYIGEQKLVRENASAVERCLKLDGPRVVKTIAAISDAGRAPKNDPALFVLAMAAKLGDAHTRKAALEALPVVARIGTHLFHFARYLELFGGWGRGTRKAVGSWYDRPDLAMQLVKYQQRDGWSHRDLLRLSHPKAHADQMVQLRWAVKGVEEDALYPPLIAAFEEAKVSDTKRLCQLIRSERLPRECVPSEKLKEREVWAALFEQMPLTAMIRNIATMTRVGLLAPMSAEAKAVGERLTEEALKRARVHPIAVLAALMTYQQGKGERGSNTWEPVREVVDALDAAFYASFGNVVPTGKRLMLALDVSGSMSGGTIAGVPGLTPRVGSAAMALITAAVEKQYLVVGFSTSLINLDISPRQRLDDVVRKISNLPFAGTDCSLPMLAAEQVNIEIDGFVVYTDSETWAGRMHPSQALRRYRDKSGIAAKSAVIGMTSNGFTIADPGDAGMMDFVGFDTATPNVLSDFLRGN